VVQQLKKKKHKTKKNPDHNMQSSCRRCLTSTNSGWMVVEWIPSSWKKHLTSSAIRM